jgi:hypothetical protein
MVAGNSKPCRQATCDMVRSASGTCHHSRCHSGQSLGAHLPLLLLAFLQLVDQLELDVRHAPQLRLDLHAQLNLRLHPLRVRLPRERALALLDRRARAAAGLRGVAHRLFLLERRAAVEQPLVGEDALDLAALEACLLHEAELLVEKTRLVLEAVAPRLVLDPAWQKGDVWAAAQSYVALTAAGRRALPPRFQDVPC